MSWTINGRVTEVTRTESEVLDEFMRATGKQRVYLKAKVTALAGPGFKVHDLMLYSYEDDVPLAIGTKISVTVEES